MTLRRGTRADSLVQRCGSDLAAAIEQRFIQDATKGTLEDEHFALYLLIEERFVQTAARTLGLVISQSTTWDDICGHAASLYALTTEQRTYFSALRGRWPVSRDPAPVLDRADVLSEFVDNLSRTHGRAGAVTAMFAAETLYLSWCRQAKRLTVKRSPDLQDWIDLHVAPPFAAQVEYLGRQVSAITEGTATDEQLGTWFCGMLRAEVDFHDAVYRR
jgi:thiaminase/transcriptional activator TenA